MLLNESQGLGGFRKPDFFLWRGLKILPPLLQLKPLRPQFRHQAHDFPVFFRFHVFHLLYLQYILLLDVEIAVEVGRTWGHFTTTQSPSKVSSCNWHIFSEVYPTV